MKATRTFSHRAFFRCTARELYDWHSREGALERLIPPWHKCTVLARTGTITPGSLVDLRLYGGPFPFRWQARHVAETPGEMFRDIQQKGPFAQFSHSHYFSDTEQGALLEEQIEYALPCHRWVPTALLRRIDNELRRVFHYRENVLRDDLALHRRCSSKPLRLLVSGASGVIGQTLVPLLTTGGHDVWTLVRRRPNRNRREIFWDPQNGQLDPAALPQLDGVIHLAGAYIGLGRWSTARKKRVLESRVKGTRVLVSALAALATPPEVFLCASAIGYYGDCRSLLTDEDAGPGDGYISEVCRTWEEEAEHAAHSGMRTILMRLGVGLTPRGGALRKLNTPLGLIRRFGDGEQYISWMSLDDMAAAMLHCLVTPQLAGPLNIAAPLPVTNAAFMRTLAKVTGRPLLFPVSTDLLQLIYGQMASEILLSGCRVSVSKLVDSGFTLRHPSLDLALAHLLGKPSPTQ